MKQSDSIASLAAALGKAQAEIENASKNAANPHFRSRYADLAEVLNTARPVLAKNGLSITQWPGYADGIVTVETVLSHSSGEWMSGIASAPIGKQDAQGVGSAVTYLRRYSLAAVAGIAQEDDDGNAAAAKPEKAAKPDPALVEALQSAAVQGTEVFRVAWAKADKAKRATVDAPTMAGLKKACQAADHQLGAIADAPTGELE